MKTQKNVLLILLAFCTLFSAISCRPGNTQTVTEETAPASSVDPALAGEWRFDLYGWAFSRSDLMTLFDSVNVLEDFDSVIVKKVGLETAAADYVKKFISGITFEFSGDGKCRVFFASDNCRSIALELMNKYCDKIEALSFEEYLEVTDLSLDDFYSDHFYSSPGSDGFDPEIWPEYVKSLRLNAYEALRDMTDGEIAGVFGFETDGKGNVVVPDPTASYTFEDGLLAVSMIEGQIKIVLEHKNGEFTLSDAFAASVQLKKDLIRPFKLKRVA